MIMTILDDALLSGVKNILSTVGKSTGVTFWVEEQSYYDAATQEQFEYPAVAHAPKITPPTYERVVGAEREIQSVTTLLAASGLTFTPVIKMEFEIDGEKFRINQLKPIYSGDSIAAYKVTGT